MKLIKDMKWIIAVFAVMLFFFIVAERGAYKLLMDEGGEKWSPREHTGSIHHK